MEKFAKYFFWLLLTFFLSGINITIAAEKLSRKSYIDLYAPMAIQEMREYKIPASITMAQACLESSDGNSELTLKSNNHFGIKCRNDWKGPSVRHNDDAANECFRKYANPIESFRDHSMFLVSSTRYQFLFSYDIVDYKKWAYGLKKAGYATDPNYSSKLIKIIEDFRLYELDQFGAQQDGVAEISKKHSLWVLLGFKKGTKQDNTSLSTISKHVVEKRNRSKMVIAKSGDEYLVIADEFSLKDWQIYRYNDATAGDQPEEGIPVYLHSKKRRAPRGNDFHTLKQGETLWSIAQWYGVKLKSIQSKNGIAADEEVTAGTQISLRKRLKK